MRYLPLSNLPLKPSILSLGVADHGSSLPQELSFRLLDQYFDAGGNFFDTAHIYAIWMDEGRGVSERTLGAWVRARGLRDRVLICTKGAHPDFKTKASHMSEKHIASDLTESLERLGMDHVDLYLLHRDDLQVPVADILGWLETHRRAGRIVAYGVSNWSVARMREAAVVAKAAGYAGFSASQIGFGLAVSHQVDGSGAIFMDAPTHAFHQETKFPVMGFSSQNGGFFSGKYSPATPAGTDGKRPGMEKRYGTPDNYTRLAVAGKLAAARGVSMNQIALAWVSQQPFPCFPVIGPKSIEQMEDSLGSLSVELSDKEWSALHEGRLI